MGEARVGLDCVGVDRGRTGCLKGYERGETPIDIRPADVLQPEMEKAREALKNISDRRGDILIYALYPMTGLEFLKRKYNVSDVITA